MGSDEQVQGDSSQSGTGGSEEQVQGASSQLSPTTNEEAVQGSSSQRTPRRSEEQLQGSSSQRSSIGNDEQDQCANSQRRSRRPSAVDTEAGLKKLFLKNHLKIQALLIMLAFIDTFFAYVEVWNLTEPGYHEFFEIMNSIFTGEFLEYEGMRVRPCLQKPVSMQGHGMPGHGMPRETPT
jgi:hypothetical protein